jgi:hypothetical protein
MATYVARPCPCGHRACKSWFVHPIAAVQGVHFTEEQARLVVSVLNATETTRADTVLLMNELECLINGHALDAGDYAHINAVRKRLGRPAL